MMILPRELSTGTVSAHWDSDQKTGEELRKKGRNGTRRVGRARLCERRPTEPATALTAWTRSGGRLLKWDRAIAGRWVFARRLARPTLRSSNSSSAQRSEPTESVTGDNLMSLPP